VEMCKQTFYNILFSLQEKEVISYVRNQDNDYDITICNNAAYDPKNPTGYINLNCVLFREKKFKQLRAKEKLLLLDFMKITHSNRGIYVVGINVFYAKYKKMLGISKRVIRYYLHSLRKYFAINVLKGKYYIAFQASKFQKIDKSGLRQRREYLANVVCRRGGLKRIFKSNIDDVATMIQQSEPLAIKRDMDILQIMRLCIEKSLQEQILPLLKPKRVHMLMDICLEK
ncbi:MAG: hypothetical protein RR678_11505, partial [Lachnospiraceae bacterium]